MATPTIPNEILVRRGPEGTTDVLVDGAPLPWVINMEDPISVDLAIASAGGVRLTLLARSVRVVDEQLLNVSMADHDHEHEEPAATPAAAPDSTPDPSPEPAPAPVAAATPRRVPCADDCTLKALGKGRYICDENSPSCHEGEASS